MRALEKQKNINPDDIFGNVKPCHLDGNFCFILFLYIEN